MTLLLLLACEGGLFGPSEEELLAEDNDADGFSENEGDCNDANPSVFPDNAEVCDGLDNNCDGLVDETVAPAWFLDADGDGYGGETWVMTCAQPGGYVPEGGDCDDGDPSVSPSGVEDGCDGVDDDCDGVVDEGYATAFYADADGDGYGDAATEELACSSPGSGYVDNDFDCDDGDAGVNPLATDVCNGFDDDCDGELDEDPDAVVYADGDGDGWGVEQTTMLDCEADEGWSNTAGDCDDEDATLHPDTVWYLDSDGDGAGVPGTTTQSCEAPNGYARTDDDCDDGRTDVYPGAPEACDGADQDCDGAVDEGSFSTFYLDQDGDGYGWSATTTEACSAPSNYVSDSTDCDDGDGSVYPGAPEVCDGADQDCDSAVDEGVGSTFYVDADGDGFGLSGSTTVACGLPSGYAAYPGDCNDGNASINPNGTETCNAADDDCDGDTDEGVTTTYYQDNDSDGYGSTVSTEDCTLPSGYATVDGDCDDGDGLVNPGQTEVCDNGVDDDCDGSAGSCGFFGSSTFSLDPDAHAAWYGEATGDYAGHSVAFGDYDSDGALDLAIAAEGNTSGASYSGTVYLYYGFTTAGGSLAGADDEILGNASSGGLGNRMSSGDVNGDGTDDLLISAAGTTNGGRLWVVHGPTTTQNIGSAYDGYWTGPGYNRCCDAVASRFDIDGDGNEDILVGSDGGGTSYEGQVYLFHGGATGLMSPSSTWTGAGSTNYLSTVAAGDFDADGTPDLLMGAYYNHELASYGGAAYMIRGPATTSFTLGAGSEDLRIRGDSSSAYFGSSVGTGDLDGDGVDDLLVGARGQGGTYNALGAAYVFFGPVTGVTKASKADVKITGANHLDSIGTGVWAEDLDGDGTDDFLVVAAENNGNGGAHHLKGRTWVFLGPLTGSHTVATADLLIEGRSPDAAGFSLDLADYDGDGDIDLLYGAPYNNKNSGNYTGAAYLVLGGGL